MKHCNNETGFSLIELMVVIGIVALLAAIAIPLYLSFTARAEASEALSLGSGIENRVVEYYSQHQAWPSADPANDIVGAAAPGSIRGKYVTAVTVRRGTIVASFGGDANARLDGNALILSPSAHTGAIDWICKVNDRSVYPLVPASCRHGG